MSFLDEKNGSNFGLNFWALILRIQQATPSFRQLIQVPLPPCYDLSCRSSKRENVERSSGMLKGYDKRCVPLNWQVPASGRIDTDTDGDAQKLWMKATSKFDGRLVEAHELAG